MSGAVHTPGPWKVGDEDVLFGVPFVQVHAGDYAEDGFRSIANVEAAFDGEKHLALDAETRANARLIAAAPELLETGADLLASLDPDALNPEQFNAWSALNTAIARAKGGAA